jgi:hypothetical protein
VKQRIQYFVWMTTAMALTGWLVQVDAQRRAPGQAPATQGIQTSLKVGNQAHQSNEPGKCTHAPVASIYQVMSQMWSVQQSSQGRSLSMTFWRPKDASADMLTLSISNGDGSYDVNTVRGGQPAEGSAKVTFEKSGAGGTFTLDARTKDGKVINGTIKCDAFAPHTAEGGL